MALPKSVGVDAVTVLVNKIKANITSISSINTKLSNYGVVGEIVMWLATDSQAIPEGFLKCRGQTLSVSTYPELFNVLSQFPQETRQSWGTADWTNTFNVPNIEGKYPRFSGTATGNTVVTGQNTTGDVVSLIGLIRYKKGI